jgi:hypothetical protein
MMNNKHSSITVKLLALIIGLFLAVTLPGCMDPIVSDMEAEHQRLGMIAEQDLQQSPFNYHTSSQSKALFPAP